MLRDLVEFLLALAVCAAVPMLARRMAAAQKKRAADNLPSGTRNHDETRR